LKFLEEEEEEEEEKMRIRKVRFVLLDTVRIVHEVVLDGKSLNRS